MHQGYIETWAFRCFSCFHLFFPPRMSRKICKRRQHNMKWRSLITIVFRYFSFFLSCSSLSFPFFFPYQWSRDSKDKTHEVDVFQVLSFSIFSFIFSLEIIQKNERMERKIKQRTLITLLYFIQFFNAKARVVQEHQIYVLIFFSSSYYLPKKMDSIIYVFSLFFSFYTLYFPSFQE